MQYSTTLCTTNVLALSGKYRLWQLFIAGMVWWAKKISLKQLPWIAAGSVCQLYRADCPLKTYISLFSVSSGKKVRQKLAFEQGSTHISHTVHNSTRTPGDDASSETQV